jgi:hypothetical protein
MTRHRFMRRPQGWIEVSTFHSSTFNFLRQTLKHFSEPWLERVMHIIRRHEIYGWGGLNFVRWRHRRRYECQVVNYVPTTGPSSPAQRKARQPVPPYRLDERLTRSPTSPPLLRPLRRRHHTASVRPGTTRLGEGPRNVEVIR